MGLTYQDAPPGTRVEFTGWLDFADWLHLEPGSPGVVLEPAGPAGIHVNFGGRDLVVWGECLVLSK